MRARVQQCVLLSIVSACTVTNTGNPNSEPGPEGLELLRSKLARDQTPDVSDADLARFSSDQRAFAFDLYGQVAAPGENVFFSPYSIATALAMTYAGAEGETKDEMTSALRFTLPEPALHAAFNALDLALEGRARELGPEDSGDGFALRTLNASFVQRDYAFKEPFLDVLAAHYDSGLYLADFAAAPDRERQAINAWVYDRTEERIEELLPEMSIVGLTRAVLVNTIYFKGSWLHEFDPARTTPETFHASGGDTEVPMMHAMLEVRYAEGPSYQAVALPYLSRAVRMMVLLPAEGELEAVEAELKSGLFDTARAALSEYTVDLSLPRFSFRAETKLADALKELGMERAFTMGAADFSRIGGAPGELYVDNVYHQAFVAVDEEGTEAAAATAVVINDESASPVATMRVDRPFLFFVYDDPTGQILFGGRLSEP